jgi:hypothetical protein
LRDGFGEIKISLRKELITHKKIKIMKTFYSCFLMMIAAIITTNLFSQNTFPSSGAAGIGITSPAASSLLEVKSTSKGVLISRMTKNQRDAITSPATGLLIYQTNVTPGFYYFDGAAWQPVSSTAASSANTSLSNLITPTKINVSLLPDTNNKRNLGSPAKGWKNLFLYSAVYLGGSKFLASPPGGIYGRNTAVGIGTLFSNTSGYQNTGNGDSALYSNTIGSQNTANGFHALYYNTTGSENTANGVEALKYNTTGYHNTATGVYALVSNTTGFQNTANGMGALKYNTTGFQNTANGLSALYSNVTGYWNTANGVDALYHNTTGSENTANGYSALLLNNEHYNTAFGAYTLSKTTASQYNTAVGYNAGGSYDNGYNNVFIGANTDVNNGNGYYNVIAIGQGTVCTDVSQVTIGNGSTATYRAYANWTNISDGRFKKNIKENVPGLEFINKLKPITYTLDATGIDNFLHKGLPQDTQPNNKAKAVMNKALAEKEKVVYTGFVAQDVEKIAKRLNYDFSGVDAAKNDKDLYGLRYADFVVPLVKAVQELSGENSKLKNQNDEQQNQIEDLQSRLVKLESMMNSQSSTTNLPTGQAGTKLQTTNISSASLQQNIPNPFNQSTTITYSLPAKFTSAQIIITDKNGKEIKAINISGNKGNVKVDTSTLASDAYQYSLYVDGKLIDTKQMEHLK